MTKLELMRCAMRVIAPFKSVRRMGKGCRRSNCGAVCLCDPCIAREFYKNLETEIAVLEAEGKMSLAPRDRWRELSRVSPSGKTLFVCLSCGDVSPGPTRSCREPVKLWNGEERRCEDWIPAIPRTIADEEEQEPKEPTAAGSG